MCYPIQTQAVTYIVQRFTSLAVFFYLLSLVMYIQIALRLKPDFAEAYNNLGSAYGAKGLTDKAIEQFQIALKLKPEYADAHENIGNAYLEKGLTRKAQEHFSIARRLKPSLLSHGNLYIKVKLSSMLSDDVQDILF